MARMLQIHEEDLGELERILPQLAEAVGSMLDTRQRVQFRRVQKILSDVRWNYGPHVNVSVIPADGDEDQAS